MDNKWISDQELIALLRDSSTVIGAKAADRIEELLAALGVANEDMEQVGTRDDKIDYAAHEKAVKTVESALRSVEASE